MSFDWDKIDKNMKEAVKNAGKKTDEQLATQMSSLVRLTNEDIKKLFPKPSDVEKLKELMKIVKSAENRNNKINKIADNIGEFKDIIFTLLGETI